MKPGAPIERMQDIGGKAGAKYLAILVKVAVPQAGIPGLLNTLCYDVHLEIDVEELAASKKFEGRYCGGK